MRHIGINRINPYPPSFKSTAARIIDPSKGASTWALGSHKCVINIGIFTRKAINKIKWNLKWNIDMKAQKKDKLFFINIIQISKGREAVMV